jgi:hypothetical protein
MGFEVLSGGVVFGAIGNTFASFLNNLIDLRMAKFPFS